MRQGLLWFDNTPKKAINDKIYDAVKRYRKKYGVDTDMVYVNAMQISDVNLDDERLKGVTVKERIYTPLNYVWLGRVSEGKEKEGSVAESHA